MSKEQIEKAREYLRNIKAIGNSLSWLEDRINLYKNLCENCTNVISDMPRGSSKNTEDLYIKLADLKEKYNTELLVRDGNYLNTCALIESLHNERHRALLHYYYIERYPTWEKVADKLGLSPERIKQLHNEALNEFSKIMEEDE